MNTTCRLTLTINTLQLETPATWTSILNSSCQLVMRFHETSFQFDVIDFQNYIELQIKPRT